MRSAGSMSDPYQADSGVLVKYRHWHTIETPSALLPLSEIELYQIPNA